ncbi:glycoside hydrolase family 65 protein [Clostridium paraputrificum]|uniref:glycoside hydrolase family 65 protein n=1 Tax=Clostridium paraputrificum TaxID=29363 RepID=UPI001FA8F865|nr:glycosyl hydrolase family 65 protein [Clostridium paraputrificum]
MMNLILNEKDKLIEQGINKEVIKANETLFALANGHLGVRGNIEESDFNKEYIDNMGTYVNGFYESSPIVYGENAYGYAKNHQTICKLPNSHIVNFVIDGEYFNFSNGVTSEHTRVLDLKEGILNRSFVWTSSTGKKVKISVERLVSQEIQELIAISYKIMPLNFSGKVTFINKMASSINIDNKSKNDDPRVASINKKQFNIEIEEHDQKYFMDLATEKSKLSLWCGFDSYIACGEMIGEKYFIDNDSIKKEIEVNAVENQQLQLVLNAGYGKIYSNRKLKDEYLEELIEVLKKAHIDGYEKIKENHIKKMNEFWTTSSIEVEGDSELNLGLKTNLFHIYQSAGRDGKTNIAAKGITGDGYEGHYFWDTEMYILPFFIYTQPSIAKALLNYRHSILEHSRERARILGINKGCLYSWRTINGEECSAYYPAGTAQFHINADIAYGVRTYFEATKDEEFMQNNGLEILIETARFWFEFGDFIKSKGNKFCINGVTGPDEYTAIVNNNYYTNLMAKNNMMYAAQSVEKFRNNEVAKKLFEKLELEDIEIDNWIKAANNMYLPYDEEKKISKQDDSFLEKAVWDFENTPEENYPLLLHYHPLTIYRYQVNKQADVMLAALLFQDEFTLEQKKRDFDYYEKITTHDSSLSKSIFGMMASEIGKHEDAYKYFMDTALMDIKNIQKNTCDGIHAANMGGSWMSLVYGFAGMKIKNDKLSFEPRIPNAWNRVKFNIAFRGNVVEISIENNISKYKLLKGNSIQILHNNKEVELTNEEIEVRNSI